MPTDFELLDAWRDGDRRAGNDLFERHFDDLYWFFRNKAGDDAQDLVQQTLLACVRAAPRFRKEASFRTYLFRAARSKLYDHWRGQAKREDLDFGVTSVADLGLSPSRALAKAEDERLLLRALTRLPLEQQVALELYYFQEMRGPELAAALDLPEGTVRSRIRLARENLRKQLRDVDEGGTLPETSVEDPDAWGRALRARQKAS